MRLLPVLEIWAGRRTMTRREYHMTGQNFLQQPIIHLLILMTNLGSIFFVSQKSSYLHSLYPFSFYPIFNVPNLCIPHCSKISLPLFRGLISGEND